jgi:serine/threonine-protein kinase
VPRETTPDPLLNQVLDERYRILEHLGEGGVGTVYRAERVTLGRTVAIKFLNPSLGSRVEFVQRFQREAIAMSKLYHVHCAALHDFGVHNGRPYLVMEYIPGRTLAADLRPGPLAPRRAIVIMRQILEALRYLHRRNIVHRDLKPQNVMLVNSSAGSDFVKVLDFGMAKILAGERRDITVEGIIVGTPGVMSPEQIEQRPVDGRSDVYAAGVVLYEMVVGHKPFEHPEMHRVMRMHIENAPVPPSRLLGPDALGPTLEEAIMRALSKNPDHRFQSAQEMSDALAAALPGAAQAQPSRRLGPSQRRPSRRRARLLLGALLLLVAVLAGRSLGG